MGIWRGDEGRRCQNNESNKTRGFKNRTGIKLEVLQSERDSSDLLKDCLCSSKPKIKQQLLKE